jgi:hypothetical protein
VATNRVSNHRASKSRRKIDYNKSIDFFKDCRVGFIRDIKVCDSIVKRDNIKRRESFLWLETFYLLVN